MQKIFYWGACFIFLILSSCKSIPEDNVSSHLQAWTSKYRDRGIGWHANNGGLSWTDEWETKYDDWIKNVPANIMVDWDIPNDCFDIAISLRWIFAFQNGLAMQIGDLKSTDFKNTEIAFLQKAVEKYGTTNAVSITYELDMNDLLNLSSGTIYRYGSEANIGHTILFRDIDDSGFVSTFEGPFPAAIVELKESTFFESTRHLKFFRESVPNFNSSVDWDSFRRFHSTLNENGRLKNVVPNNHPQAKVSSAQHEFWKCTEHSRDFIAYYKKRHPSEDTDVKLAIHGTLNYSGFWQNLRNFYQYHRELKNKTFEWKDGVTPKCPHNVYFDQDFVKNPSPAPDSVTPLRLLSHKICASISERIDIVNAGYLACHVRQSSDEALCGNGTASVHSTPSRDAKIEQLAISLTELYGNLYKFLPKSTLISCPSMDFHKGIPGSTPLVKTINVLDLTNEDDLRKPENSINYFANAWIQEKATLQGMANSYDPRVDLKTRWGCYDTFKFPSFSPAQPDRVEKVECIYE